MNLTRRDFLKLVGVSVSGAWVPTLLQGDTVIPSGVGRLFDPTVRYARPDAASATATTLWPDSVHRILGVVGDWVHIDGGYVPKTAIQPMLQAAEPSPTIIKQPTWVEVIAPSVAVRAYADAGAPLCCTVGHGGLLLVDHSFADDRGVWWLRSTQGWLQAAHVQLVTDIAVAGSAIQITLDHTHHSTIVRLNGQPVTLAACFPPETVAATTIEALPLQSQHPWAMQLDNRTLLHGTFRHNSHGMGLHAPSGRVELSIVAARWLYRHVLGAKSVSVS